MIDLRFLGKGQPQGRPTPDEEDTQAQLDHLNLLRYDNRDDQNQTGTPFGEREYHWLAFQRRLYRLASLTEWPGGR